ncbi:hypothetical protein MASR1M66_05960 [Aminivibrio sp.]
MVVVGDFSLHGTGSVRRPAALSSLAQDVPDRLLEKWDEALASCDVAAITGTALLTRSMARHLTSPQAYQFILGATASPVLINNYGAGCLPAASL